MLSNRLFILVTAAFVAAPVLAGSQVGTLTQIEGKVQVFSNPSKSLAKDAAGQRALYEGDYYLVKDATIGEKVDQGNIVRTSPGSKARVVFDNGDQINVGSGSAYKVNWDKDSEKGNTKINLMYGKMRGIMEKGGPRSRLQIRTKTAIMGVRGTDFFIAQGGPDEGTEVSIIRGAVEVKAEAPKAKPVQVKAGQSAEIAAPVVVAQTEAKAKEAPKVEPKVEIRQTTQEEFAGIQKSSQIQTPPPAQAAEAAKANPEVAKKIEQLEKKAVETTLQDIKKVDEKLYQELAAKKDIIKSTDDLNKTAVAKLAETAPKAPEKRKPYRSELEDLEAGAYDRYFKSVN